MCNLFHILNTWPNRSCNSLLPNILGEISESVSSISETYRTLLKVNKALVLYMRNVKNTQSSIVDEIQTDLKEAPLGKSS